MAGARWHPPLLVLLVLLVLAGPVTAGEPVGSRSDRTVGALVVLLLCLVVGLALAWHHLCKVSAGRYHPWPMGRRVLALLRGRWHRLRGQGDPETQPYRKDGEVAAAPPPLDEEEELMPWSQEQQKEEKDEDEEDEEEEEEEEKEAEVAPQGGESPPLDGGEVGAGGGGSSEALLSDLHAFSGTAGWGEAKPHVTAL